MTIKERLEATLKLWHSLIEELSAIGNFLHHDRINEQFYRRLLIRSIISVIETYLNVTNEIIKIKVVTDPNTQLSWEELAILNEKSAKLDDNGKVRVIDDFHRFEPRLKFTLGKFAEMFQAESPNFRTSEFDKLRSLIKKRNQLTHPQSLEHLFVTDDEVRNIIEAFTWFFGVHSKTNIKFIEWLANRYPGLE